MLDCTRYLFGGLAQPPGVRGRSHAFLSSDVASAGAARIGSQTGTSTHSPGATRSIAAAIRSARASIFTAQAIALDLIAAGRQKRVDQLLEHAASIVSGVASEPLVEATTYAEECDTEGGNT